MPTLADARQRDRADPLAHFRARFHLPSGASGGDAIYLCGNSLGLQPRSTAEAIQRELDDWRALGVEGHFAGRNPWYSYHEPLQAPLAEVVGARPHEVVAMNGLTVNLHLLLLSFYRPTPERFVIVVAAGAFPSDRYALASQAQLHGLDPANAIVEVAPRPGTSIVEEEDLLRVLDERRSEVALVLLSGVHYYTGQAFQLAEITRKAHEIGAIAGFDLAHAAGNLALQLHDWCVDFAAWCSYKYLNAGPGSVGCAFVHDRHALRPELHRLAGWWGNDPATRFSMPERFVPQRGAAGWQLSNAPVLSMAPLKASLAIFEEAGMAALRCKSEALSSFLLTCLDDACGGAVDVITPRAPHRRGCQLSLRFVDQGEPIHRALTDAGVVCDFRRPDVIRVAPVPLYNTFEDCWRFADIIAAVLRKG